MSLHNAQFEINAMLKIEPKMERIIRNLESYANAFHVTKGYSVPAMIRADYRHLPVLFIASRRMRNAWFESRHRRGVHISVDGCATDFHSSSYLTWSGDKISFAIDTRDLADVFSDGELFGVVLVVWVADTVMTLDSFSVDEEFLEILYVADQSRHIPRFVPDKDYVEARLADFPPLMSPDELRIIGAAGEPVYLAVACDEQQNNLQPQLDLEPMTIPWSE